MQEIKDIYFGTDNNVMRFDLFNFKLNLESSLNLAHCGLFKTHDVLFNSASFIKKNVICCVLACPALDSNFHRWCCVCEQIKCFLRDVTDTLFVSMAPKGEGDPSSLTILFNSLRFIFNSFRTKDLQLKTIEKIIKLA